MIAAGSVWSSCICTVTVISERHDRAESGHDRPLAIDERKGHERREHAGDHRHDQSPEESARCFLVLGQHPVAAEAGERAITTPTSITPTPKTTMSPAVDARLGES